MTQFAGRPGAALLEGAVDNHIHACPHLNLRSLDVFQAVEQAAEAGMRAIGFMDNFSNTSGYAALVNRRLGHLGVEAFGGLIMEPPAGGVAADAVATALAYGYSGDGRDGARFISLPTHHTRHIARQENRSDGFVESCFAVPELGPMPDPLPEIFDLIAKADAVFNTGHVSGPEAIRVVEAARDAGVNRVLVPASHYDIDVVEALVALGGVAEFSFFFVSHATQAPLTHVDAARNTVPPVSAARMTELIRAADPGNCILSSDCGVALLPPPVEGLREFCLLLATHGLAESDLRRMIADTPSRLFRLDPPTPSS